MCKLNWMCGGKTGLALLAMGSLILMSWTGCAGPRVIRSDEVVTPIRAGTAFTAPMDGWFLSDALYLRYRKAVADRIQELQAGGGKR